MTAENYHLKWDSHATYLNSSVATLYKNEKYADVVLYSTSTTGTSTSTPNALPNVGISAHKFILSSCSQYFSNIFESSPLPNNGPFYVILPPDLSHRAVQILVQYMYMGEATVSNDILNEVLKGGEILKIRGLCRTNNNNNHVNKLTHNSQNGCQPSYNLTRMPSVGSNTTAVRYVVEHPKHMGLIASVLPKDSPVIIKTAKPLSSLAAASTPAPMGSLSASKPLLLDADESKCGYAGRTAPVARDENTAPICLELGCKSCNRPKPGRLQQLIIPREPSDATSDATTILNPQSSSASESYITAREYIAPVTNDCLEEVPSEIYAAQDMDANSIPPDQSTAICDYVTNEPYSYTSRLAHLNQRSVLVEAEMQHLVTPPATEAKSFVAIKEEPAEWQNTSSANQQLAVDCLKKSIATINDYSNHSIKVEAPPPAAPTAPSAHDSDQLITTSGCRMLQKDVERFFQCETCKQIFEDKTKLLNHVESHATQSPSTAGFPCSMEPSTSAAAKSYVPKKRRRTSQQENAPDHACLQCDLCTTRFETPAEWVRHMSSQHTNVELALFNSKKDSEKFKPTTSMPGESATQKKLTGSIQAQHPSPQQQLQKHLPLVAQTCGNTNSSFPANNASSTPYASGPEMIGEMGMTDSLRPTMSPA